MTKIPTSITPPNVINLDARKQNLIAGTSSFDALLSSPASSGSKFINEFLENITNSANDNSQSFGLDKFPFTTDFVSTFGTSGPLPAFIAKMTSKLGLNAAQIQAFQDIAVRNKDITKTPENVQKIALEIKQAGIIS